MVDAALAIVCLSIPAADAQTPPGTAVIRGYGYDTCILLHNDTTRVVLEPNCGGRVIEYALGGKNSLYVDRVQDGYVYDGGKRIEPCAGRYDIGPAKTTPRRDVLWLGRWTGRILGERRASLTSRPDPATGVQLVREFELAVHGTGLRFTQTMRNVSNRTTWYCHWSRTFCPGGGIVVIPLTRPSRYPHKYVTYGPGPVANYRPVDPNVRDRDGFIEIVGRTRSRKLCFDSQAGWLAYLTPDDLLFVKRFPVYPDRVYNEIMGMTLSIWYDMVTPGKEVCELEPVSPRERLEPGQSASFTEHWRLLPYAAPRDGRPLDLKALAKFVHEQTDE